MSDKVVTSNIQNALTQVQWYIMHSTLKLALSNGWIYQSLCCSWTFIFCCESKHSLSLSSVMVSLCSNKDTVWNRNNKSSNKSNKWHLHINISMIPTEQAHIIKIINLGLTFPKLPTLNRHKHCHHETYWIHSWLHCVASTCLYLYHSIWKLKYALTQYNSGYE